MGDWTTKGKGHGKAYVSVTTADDPKYAGKKVVSVNTNTDTIKNHKTYISDSKGNFTDVKKK